MSDAENYSTPNRTVERLRQRAIEARLELMQNSPNPPVAVKKNAAVALTGYRNQLLIKHDSGLLETPWDEREPDVDQLDQWVGNTIEVERDLNRRNSSATESEKVEVIEVVNWKKIELIGQELDKIASELGIDFDTKSEDSEMYQVKRDPEDYPEPKNNDINKPQ